MNPLADSPQIRKALYTIQYVVSGVMLLLGVAWATLPDTSVPQWYITTSAVLSALWAYTGITAAANTDTTRPEPPVATTHEVDGQLALFEIDDSGDDVQRP